MAITGFTVTVDGTSRTANLEPNTFNVTDNLWARNTCKFTLRDDALNYRPLVGHSILFVYDTGFEVKLFAGTIDQVEETYYGGAQPYRKYKIIGVDYNQICDRFLVVDSFVDPLQTLSDIVTYIVDTYLAADGVTYAGEFAGPIIPETKLFNYRTVTQVFNELATLTNFVWFIDYEKSLKFIPKSSNPSTISLNHDNVISATVVRSRGMGPYRNVQYVRAGTDMTDERVEPLRGDGFRRTFNVVYPIERTPTITLNSVPVTVGILGLDSGKQYYWTRGSNQIAQDESQTLLTASDVLAVTYIGRYPVIVAAQRDTEIANRQSIEGGSGIYQSLYTDPNLNDLRASQNLATSLLDRYGYIPDNIIVETYIGGEQFGLRAGQLVSCDFPLIDAVGDYLVHSVSIKEDSGARLAYRVNLMNFLSL